MLSAYFDGMTPMLRYRQVLTLAAAALFAAHGAMAEVVPPLPPGAHPVGCSDIAQDFSRLEPGENPQQYWEGIPASNGRGRYVTELLAEPSSTPVVAVSFPDNDDVFGDEAGDTLPVALLICYPTTADTTGPPIRCRTPR